MQNGECMSFYQFLGTRHIMNATKKTIAVLTCLTCMSISLTSVQGQENTDLTKLHEQINAFFANLNNETVETKLAFADLIADGPLAKNENVKNLIAKYDEITGQYGKYLEHEQVDARFIGKDLAILRYLYKAERFPVVWYFTFYRPPLTPSDDNKWMIVTIRFDTRLELLGLLPK